MFRQCCRIRTALALASSLIALVIVSPVIDAQAGEVWVDASGGDDGNTGTEIAPFATITHAVTTAGAGAIIHVGPGTYDAVQGETFPIALLDNQQLLGDPANRGGGTTPTAITGHGFYASPIFAGSAATLVSAAGSTISGFQIGVEAYQFGVAGIVVNGLTATVSGNSLMLSLYMGVLLRDAGSSNIQDNEFHAKMYGIYVSYCPDAPVIEANVFGASEAQIDLQGPDTDARILGNTFLAGSSAAVYVQHGYPRVEGNTFEAGSGTKFGAIMSRFVAARPVVRSNIFLNELAIVITDGTPDIGVGGDQGLNDFRGVNGICIQHDGSANVSARGNHWPHDPPIVGVDIIINGSGSVNATSVPITGLSVGRLKASY